MTPLEDDEPAPDFTEPHPADLEAPQEPAPITRPARQSRREHDQPGTNGTHPLEDRSAEQHVLACCFLDEGPSLDRARQSLSPQDFAFPEHAILFRQLSILRQEQKPITTEVLVQERAAALAGVNPMLLVELTDPSKYPTTAHAGYMIARVADLARRRAIRQAAKATLEALENGADMAALDELLTLSKGGVTSAQASQRTPFEFALAARTHASVLLGNRYLNRGDGLVISSSSGMGKSSMQLQMAASWAHGLPFHGLPCNGPLRSLIIQSEDSDGDIAEVWASIEHVEQWDDAAREQLKANIRIVTDRVSRGTTFLASLKKHVAQFKPDLVWINPLQAFIDGDVTESKDLGAFLREGLNSLNEPASFGYILIHHTTKPATGKDRSERLWHEVMYDMAGGAELINWARGIISLRPTEQEGVFRLRLAKRGRRAGVTKEVTQGVGHRQEIVTEIGLKHATGTLTTTVGDIPLIYWEAAELTTPTDDSPGKPATGRPEKYAFADYRSLFPTKAQTGMTLNELHRALLPNGEIQKKNLHQVCKRWSEQGDVEIIDLHGMPRRYRASF